MNTPLFADFSLLDLNRHFVERFGGSPRRFYAPGRVNLIGEHTDYNDGFVLPMAINRGTCVLANATHHGVLRVHAQNINETITVNWQAQYPTGHWSDYVAGMASIIRQQWFAGEQTLGGNILIYGDLPLGAGLSSSASLECAVGLALSTLWGVNHGIKDRDKTALALMGQQAEHQYAGTQCGIMDQLICTMGQVDHALLIDCRHLQIQPSPLRLADHNLALVICDSGVSHQLATSAYNQRRQECAEGFACLQPAFPHAKALRDITPDMPWQTYVTDKPLRQRVRHVVTENARTLQAAQALNQSDFATFGQLMNASHASLRDDYAVSCPELDCLVDAAQSVPGVLGARMTGGGFGGCTVNLVSTAAMPVFLQTVTDRYHQAFNRQPNFYETPACEGVREL